MSLSLDSVAHTIQLAIAPVFLLTAVGTIIGVLANRLARIVDRTRMLEERCDRGSSPDAPGDEHDLRLLASRLRLIYLAIALEVSCSLGVGLVIATAFVDALLAVNLTSAVVGLFGLAMLAFIAGLIVFLREIFLAVTGQRQRAAKRSARDAAAAAGGWGGGRRG